MYICMCTWVYSIHVQYVELSIRHTQVTSSLQINKALAVWQYKVNIHVHACMVTCTYSIQNMIMSTHIISARSLHKIKWWVATTEDSVTLGLICLSVGSTHGREGELVTWRAGVSDGCLGTANVCALDTPITTSTSVAALLMTKRVNWNDQHTHYHTGIVTSV